MKSEAKIKTEDLCNRSRETVKIGGLQDIVPPLLEWYDGNARSLPWRENPVPYAVWISEIMLQQTRVESVKPYFDRWMAAFSDLPSLAAASEETVLKLWEGLGYYSRVRNIHRTAKIVMEKYDGSLPATFDELRSLPGIGEYTAGAVGSIAFHLPVPCIDGNVLRVVTRLAAEKSDIGAAVTKKLLTGWVSGIIPNDRPGDFNQAMMELGATVCLPNGLPKCEICPVASLCRARIQNRATEFPVKSGKPPRKIEKKTVLVLVEHVKEAPGAALTAAPGSVLWAGPKTTQGAAFRTALRKRPDTGLLAGLWEFPNFDGDLSEEEVRRILEGSGLKIASLAKLKKTKHIFTHIEWEMTGYLAFCESGPAQADFQWVGTEHLEERLTLPAAFNAYHQILKHLVIKEC